MMSDEKPDPQPLTVRFADLWGEQAAAVVLLGSVIRVAEEAMYEDDLGTQLKKIKSLAEEGLASLEDDDAEKPQPGFGFSKE